MGGLFLIENDNYGFLIHQPDDESGFAAGDYLKGDMHLVMIFGVHVSKIGSLHVIPI